MNQKGFTLIELLVVVSIIGILTAIVMPLLHEYRERAWAAKVIGMTETFHSAQEAYFTDNETYLSCTVDQGSSTCGALPGMNGVDMSGFSSIQMNLPAGVLIGVCHRSAPDGYALVTDPANPLYTHGVIEHINLGAVGTCTLGSFS